MKWYDWPRVRRQVTAVVGLLVLSCCVGCGGATQAENKPQLPGEMVDRWVNEMGAGTPHRGTLLRDGTEIVTIGDDDHGRFLMLIRYRGDERFEIITERGDKVE